LPREVFARHGMLNLQRLYLSNCRIGQIDPTAFRGLTNLVELNLAGNLLTAVPTPTFAGTFFFGGGGGK
jgi:Leucine-rich repeat (LRR) protein